MLKSEKLDASTPPEPACNNVNDDRFERPPLRSIDKYVRAALCSMSARYTVAFMTMMGFIILFGMGYNFCALSRTFYEVRVTHSSYHWAYTIATIPGGFLVTFFPAHRIFGIAICTSAILCMIIPGAVMLGNVVVLIVIRSLQGLVEGVILPACYGIWRYWSPPQERTRMPTIAFCGTLAGSIIGVPMSQALSRHVGWQSPFYFYSLVGIFWYLAWLWLVFEKPQMHPTIWMEEKEYIERSLGENTSTAMKSSIPFRKIVTSGPVYAIIVANFCGSWMFYTIYQDLYFKTIFNYDESFDDGTVLSSWITVLVIPFGGILADYLRKSGKMTTTNVRKLFTCGCFGIQSIMVVVASLAGTESSELRALNVGAVFGGLAFSGYNINHLDISPKYASILMGLSNGIGIQAIELSRIVTYYDVGYSWFMKSMVPVIVSVFGIIFYGIFASGELQPWDGPQTDSQTTRNRNEGGCPTEGI